MSRRWSRSPPLIQQMERSLDAADEKAARRKKRWRRIALVVGPLLLGLAPPRRLVGVAHSRPRLPPLHPRKEARSCPPSATPGP